MGIFGFDSKNYIDSSISSGRDPLSKENLSPLDFGDPQIKGGYIRRRICGIEIIGKGCK